MEESVKALLAWTERYSENVQWKEMSVPKIYCQEVGWYNYSTTNTYYFHHSEGETESWKIIPRSWKLIKELSRIAQLDFRIAMDQ